MNKKIIIVAGDPNSINSEIIFKTWKNLSINIRKKIYLISDLELMKTQLKKLRLNIEFSKTENLNSPVRTNKLKIINTGIKFNDPFKINEKNRKKFIKNSLRLAHKLALNKNVSGIINCAIDKKLLPTKQTGVTEFLAKECNLKKDAEVMLIYNKKLAVSPVTTHINLRNVAKNINKIKIIQKVKTIDSYYKRLFKKKPKIGILGLNPHNAELRNNSEEKKIIIPCINKLKKKGINITGPLISDTLFINDHKKYDVIIGMYHDQVLAPFKTLFKFDAINITLGLKYLRVSPDHGTAVDLIKKNKANPLSLINCIKFLHHLKK